MSQSEPVELEHYGRRAAILISPELYDGMLEAYEESQDIAAFDLAMAETGDGFEIARRDLEIRGPGEFLGARQSGAALLRFADLSTDVALLEWARSVAPRMLDQYPELAQRHIDRWLGGKAEFLKA